MRKISQTLRQFHRERNAGKIVVTERWMTDVAGKQHFFRMLSRYETLAVRQKPVLQRGVDADLVFRILHLHKVTVP